MRPEPVLNNLLARFGFKCSRTYEQKIRKEEPVFFDIYEKCRAFTMTSTESMYSLFLAVRYIVDNHVPGDMVECGVWQGGSDMLMALTLLKSGGADRTLYLYDTYAGMAMPSEKDKDFLGKPAIECWKRNSKNNRNEWLFAGLNEVKEHLFSTGYPKEKLKFIQGKVEETIPAVSPEAISLLRLDTDLFNSTYHELTHLYPKLSVNGIIIIDDYDYYKGQRQAVDKYFNERGIKILLSPVDGQARIGIKTK